MKRLLLLLALAWALPAQTLTQSSFATTATRGSDVPNVSNNPAIGWRLTFWYTGFTAVTMQLDCAPDNGSGVAGTYAACGGAVDGTTNPVTASSSPQSGTIALKLSTPHIAVNPTSVTGSGTVHWVLTGLWGAFNVPTTVTTSGGGSSTAVTTICTSQAQVALSGTGYTSIVAASGSMVVSICNFEVTSASVGTPVVNTFTLSFGSCSGTPTNFLTAAGVTGYTDQFFGNAKSAAGGAFCVKESVANSDLVTVTYLQQ